MLMVDVLEVELAPVTFVQPSTVMAPSADWPVKLLGPPGVWLGSEPGPVRELTSGLEEEPRELLGTVAAAEAAESVAVAVAVELPAAEMMAEA